MAEPAKPASEGAICAPLYYLHANGVSKKANRAGAYDLVRPAIAAWMGKADPYAQARVADAAPPDPKRDEVLDIIAWLRSQADPSHHWAWDLVFGEFLHWRTHGPFKA